MRSIPISLLAFAVGVPLVVAQQTTPNPQPSTGSNPQITSPQQTNPQQGPTGSSGAASVPGTANSPEASNPGLRPISGQLVTKLDTKDTKTGDNVIIKTTEKATTASGIEIPKGSRITGHVTDVEAQGKNGDNSRLTIQLDQAEITGGQNLAIRSVIQSVAPAGSGSSADANGGPPVVPSEGSTNGSSTGSPTSGSASPGGTSTDNRAAPAAAPSTAPGLPPPGSVVAQKGNIVIRTTSIPGVLLVGDVNGHPFSNAAGALLGAQQDVHLDDGTMMVVAVMEVPPANAH